MQQELFDFPKRFDKKQYWENFKYSRKLFLPSLNNPEFCEHMNGLARKYMGEMTVLAIDKYRGKIYTTKIDMVLDWSRNRKTSRGGMKKRKGYLSINMARSTMPFPVIEYARINKDPVIGYMNTWSSEIHLACTIAHELAHVFQYLIRYKVMGKTTSTKSEREYHRRGHGENWQHIYRFLRSQYVNKMAGV